MEMGEAGRMDYSYAVMLEMTPKEQKNKQWIRRDSKRGE
jgi:hypothetical protein